jgi:putative FmdB family regulatory protein
MPIREYRCETCRTEFEELVFGDSLPPCPACGAGDVRQLMSRCCVHESGGGEFSMPSGQMPASGGCSGCAGGNCGSCR